jgi:prepilin-type N-terminal cleavage/methylation domain-containing protein
MRFNQPLRLEHRHSFAFTLVEVMIASAVLGTAVVSLYAGFSSGFAVLQLAREDLRATEIMTEKIEAVRLCTWEQLSSFPISFQENYELTADTNSPGGLVYYGTISADSPDAIPDNEPYKQDMRLITVSLQWTNYNNGANIVRMRQMQTHLARFGLQNYSWGGTQ